MGMKKENLDWNLLHENLKEVVSEAGYFYISDRPLSTHPDDWYLRVAFGFKMIGDRSEYGSWVYNATLGEKGSMGEGHYITDENTAREDYLSRR